MIYVAWATALADFCVSSVPSRRYLAAFFAGIILFVANLNFMDPNHSLGAGVEVLLADDTCGGNYGKVMASSVSVSCLVCLPLHS